MTIKDTDDNKGNDPKNPSGGDRHCGPELERRQGRRFAAWAPIEGTPPAMPPVKSFGPPIKRHVNDIYLIERQAIRLRRIRSQQNELARHQPDEKIPEDLKFYARRVDNGRPGDATNADQGILARAWASLQNFVHAVTKPPEAPGDSQTGVPPHDEVPPISKLVGLALSGGGIRSASFNLGFLQGLAYKNLLGEFDYLSTVSGGGFIAAWWSAWLSRRQRQPGELFPQPEELETQRRSATDVLLDIPKPSVASDALPDGSLSANRDDPIHFVRLFSNYLTPNTGAMSPDTWRLIAYFVRSLLFTWLALIPILFAAVLTVQSVYLFDGPTAAGFLESGASMDSRLEFLKLPAVVVLSIYATLVVIWLIESAANRGMAAIAVCALLVALWLSVSSGGDASLSRDTWVALGSSVLTLGSFLVISFFTRKSQHDNDAPVSRATPEDRRTWLTQQQERVLRLSAFGFMLLLGAAFGHDVLYWVFRAAGTGLAAALTKAGGWAALILTVVSSAYTVIQKAPTTTEQHGAEPRLIGKLLLLIAPPLLVVFLLLAIAFCSQYFLAAAVKSLPSVLAKSAKAAICLAVVEVVLAIYESCRDPPLGAAESNLGWRRLVPHFLVAPIDFVLQKLGRASADATDRPWYYFFSPRGWARVSVLASVGTVLGLGPRGASLALWKVLTGTKANLLALAILAAVWLLSFARLKWRISLKSARPAVLLTIASVTATFCLLTSSMAIEPSACLALLWVTILIGGVIALGWLADPNLISLHGFYKARLARAYLGASNTGRDNQEITDAAPGDDIPLDEVWNHDQGAPYHLCNTTLNLVGGSDLALSQRSAENFILSRYHCGSARAGYRCTDKYMSGELTLATAVAISGAAVSPTMGSKSPSAALTLLLSLFNIRLGFWAPTPSGKRWYEGHARLWPFYLLRETLANTGTLGTYCYLTDGGHFDNTGLYALIERGCRHIVVCDCGADPTPSFEDIGTAIRRCRIDFGTEIDLKIDDFVIAESANGVGTVQVAHGTISYQPEHLQLLGLDVRTEQQGTIVWVKPTVTALSAADVRQYRRAHRDFPQQSTAEQWYDESQFESYRRLGYESAMHAAPVPPAGGSPVNMAAGAGSPPHPRSGGGAGGAGGAPDRSLRL